MLINYHGHVEMTFPGWLDTETGKSLHCIPGGGPYDVIPASMHAVDPADCPHFTLVKVKKETPARPEDELPSKAEKEAVWR